MWGTKWPRPEELNDLTPHQREEYAKATAAPVGVLIGTPGTGKTWTVAKLVTALLDAGKSVTLCAPTGKAAVRITESLNGVATARTIHKACGLVPGDNGSLIRTQGPHETGLANFVIVDESGMLGLSLSRALLSVLRPGQHILFVGDPYQLPPVDRGAVLRDLIASRTIPVGTLTEVKRNDGGIVDACAAISRGEQFEITPNVVHLPGDPVQSAVDLYKAVRGQAEGFDKVQILCPLNKGKLGREMLNAKIRAGSSTIQITEETPYQVGEKIIILRNGNYGDYGVYLANGEQGRIYQVGKDRLAFMFKKTIDGNVVVQISKKDPNWALAYAITCHKAQGSEWPAVGIVLDRTASRVTNRNWIYTAISRAKKRVYLLGDLQVAYDMIERDATDSRKTFLAEQLRETAK